MIAQSGTGKPTAATPGRAMVLAAGLGLRMRPITEHLPKPLIAIGGRTLLDRILDRLAAAGVAEAVVNTHYLGPMIADHLAARRRPRIRLSPEEALLETGGGITRALPLLGPGHFFAINGDVLWRDGAVPALHALAAAWDGEAMDALLLLQPIETAVGYHGPGDFFREADGRLVRRGDASRAPYIFAGLQILHPRLFAAAPAGPFSTNVVFDQAIAAGRLAGVVHQGGWCHVGTPADIPPAEAFVAAASGEIGAVPARQARR
jgi:MurNAc alpha-1-phosphate uridylyltransferase